LRLQHNLYFSRTFEWRSNFFLRAEIARYHDIGLLDDDRPAVADNPGADPWKRVP
jgi:hypothetical protein